jgi:hypothetical protein
MNAKGGAVARLVVIDLLGSVVWFPAWWYTTGLLRVISSARRAMAYRASSYGFRIWIKNFFVPMYGQADLTGKLVSIFMRFVVLVGRSIAFVVESIIYGAGILLWMLAPILAIAFGVINALRAI